MLFALVIAALFDMIIKETRPDEITIIIVKVGCIASDETRPHEFTPYEEAILTNPGKFIIGYAGQRVNLYVLLIDKDYSRGENRYPILVKNNAHYIWQPSTPVDTKVPHSYQSCVIPDSVEEGELKTLFADFELVAERMPLCAMIFMHFTSGFADMVVENPKIFAEFPGDCFIDVCRIFYNVVFKIEDEIMLPFKSADAPESIAFMNNAESHERHFDAICTLLQQFMCIQRKKIELLLRIQNGIKLVTGLSREDPESRFSFANIQKTLYNDIQTSVIKNLYYRIGNPRVTSFFKQIVDFWLNTAKSGTLVDLLQEMIQAIISDISKVNAVAYLVEDRDVIFNLQNFAKVLSDAFPFMTIYRDRTTGEIVQNDIAWY